MLMDCLSKVDMYTIDTNTTKEAPHWSTDLLRFVKQIESAGCCPDHIRIQHWWPFNKHHEAKYFQWLNWQVVLNYQIKYRSWGLI